jgi:hypothetical protein
VSKYLINKNKYAPPPPPPPHYLSIVAIIKNEAPYIAEWLEYHLIVGVTKFYLYDNESEDNIKEILEPYIKSKIVEYKYYPGRKKQTVVYNDILKKARKETHWLAVIDCDEFIVPISTQTIPEFLKDFESYAGIEINWVVYGSSGQKNKKIGLVIERFKDHSLFDFDRNKHIKTILNPRLVFQVNVHDAVYVLNKFSVNTHKENTKTWFLDRDAIFDKIRINHYFSKSYEEFLLKRQRGMATHNSEIRPMQDFYDHDRNEEKNDEIMDKYIPIIYKNLEQRHTYRQQNDKSIPCNEML